MCAAVTTPPLREPQHYSPCFKVEVCLTQPLWASDKCLHEVMSLCAVLELLCKKEAAQMQKEKRAANNLSTAFKDKSRIIIDHLEALSPRLPPGGLLSYVQTAGIAEIYPRAARYLHNPGQIPADVNWAAIEDHLTSLSSLQKICGLASQISHDIQTLSNHKYIAHQLALLHQSLAAVSKVSHMAAYKQTIEGQFSTIKQHINDAQDRGENPHLGHDLQTWIQTLTSRLIATCQSLPPEIQDCLQPATSTLAANN